MSAKEKAGWLATIVLVVVIEAAIIVFAYESGLTGMAKEFLLGIPR